MASNQHLIEPEELMAYLDGELRARRAAEVAEHIHDCRECQIVAAEFGSVSEALTVWEVDPVSQQMPAEIATAVETSHSTEPAGRSRGWLPRLKTLSFRGPGIVLASALSLSIAILLSFSVPKSTPKYPELAARVPSTPAPAERNAELLKSKPMNSPASSVILNEPQAIPAPSPSAEHAIVPNPPMILRTAQITLVTPNLDTAREEMGQIVRRFGGYLGNLGADSPSDGSRKLTATLRIPAGQLDAALLEVKKLGRVESESQTGLDVTAQYVDLEARLNNSRNTERRLIDLLNQRTGKLSDVLEVETEISRVREEIERMEGERRLMAKQIEFATVTASLTEEYKAPARPLPDSLGTRLRNAAIDGYQSVISFVVGVVLFVVSDGPMLLVWVAILFFPARWAWRKWRSHNASS